MAFVGCVVDPIDHERSAHYGACFAWGDGRHFVTADHVIEAAIERGAQRLTVLGPGDEPDALFRAPVRVVARDPLRDVALLATEESEAVNAFQEAAAPIVGEVVGSLSFIGDGVDQLVSRVTGLGRIAGTSTATTRGSESGADVPFEFSAVVIADDVADGFCGAPLVNASGVVVGVISKGRDGHAFATRFDRTVPWIAENINNDAEDGR